MQIFNSKAVLVGAFLSSVGLLSAATPSIGIAMSEGNIFINNSASAGNATIFDGSTLETQSAVSQVRLNGGAQLRLASDSKVTVYSDHVDLKKGSAKITGYSANASGLSVRADGTASAAISMRGQGVVEIASLTGDVHVFNAAGFNVANLLPGRSLDLKPQDAGASAPSNLTGCTKKSGGDTLLTDETSNVTVQLKGGNEKNNRRYQVTGSMVPNATPASGATQVLNVASAKELGACQVPGGVVPVAAGGAAAAGLSSAAIAGIAIGVAAAVAVGATAAAGGFSSSNAPQPNVTP